LVTTELFAEIMTFERHPLR